LKEFLTRELAHVNFDDGQVWKGEGGGPIDTRDLSPQCDIIAYHGSPIYERFGHVVVPLNQILLVLEVKKWVRPSDTFAQIQRLRGFLRKPVLLVGFRHDGDYAEIAKKAGPTSTFLFSKRSPQNRYPDDVANFETSCLRKGELERLVKEIGKNL
jgi:hypothetical protein